MKINLISPMTIEESQILQPRNWVDLTCSAITTIPFQLSPSNPHFVHCFYLYLNCNISVKMEFTSFFSGWNSEKLGGQKLKNKVSRITFLLAVLLSLFSVDFFVSRFALFWKKFYRHPHQGHRVDLNYFRNSSELFLLQNILEKELLFALGEFLLLEDADFCLRYENAKQ